MSISEPNESNYTIFYDHGDICDFDKGFNYSSEVVYVCNEKKDLKSYPEMISKEGMRSILYLYK